MVYDDTLRQLGWSEDLIKSFETLDALVEQPTLESDSTVVNVIAESTDLGTATVISASGLPVGSARLEFVR